MALGRFGSVVLVASGLLSTSMSGAALAREAALASSGLPVPRYVSLKSDHVNVRAGPTKDNDFA